MNGGGGRGGVEASEERRLESVSRSGKKGEDRKRERSEERKR